MHRCTSESRRTVDAQAHASIDGAERSPSGSPGATCDTTLSSRLDEKARAVIGRLAARSSIEHDSRSIEAATRRPSSIARWSLLGLVGLFFLAVGVFDHELWPPTEQAVAGVASGMLRTGDFLLPQINGMPYLEKPQLAYALSALCCRAAGQVSAGLVRLPSALFGLLSLALLFWTSRNKYGDAVAWVCTLMCATTFSFYEISHRACTDSAALFFVFLCFALFARTLEMRRMPRTSRAWSCALDLPFCIALAVSFFAKNFYTFLIVVPAVTCFLAATRQVGRLLSIGAMTAATLAIVLVPWCMVLYARGGSDYLRIVFFDNTIGRYFTILDTHDLGLRPLNDAYQVHKDESLLGFFFGLGVVALPWVILHAGALVALFMKRKAGEFRLFLQIATVTIATALSLSSSRVVEYWLPILFVLSLVLADFLADLFTRNERAWPWSRWLFVLNLILVAATVAMAPIVASQVLHDRVLAYLAVPNVVGIALLLYRLRHRMHTSSFALALLAFTVASATLTLSFAIPAVDELRSWRPFFDAIAPEVADREVYTSFCDDRRLPAITFYLGRDVKTIATPEDAFALLASTPNVGIILPSDFYAEQKARFDAMHVRSLNATRGKDLFAFLVRR